jgi:hypothetical protein
MLSGAFMKFQPTKIEKIMLVIYFIIVVAMLLNPPWAYFHPETGKFIESLGDNNIFYDINERNAQIHFSMLLYRIIVTGILLALVTFVLRIFSKLGKKKSHASEKI